MSRRQFAFLTTTALVLCAGVVVGRLTTRVPAATAPARGGGPSWIADQLNLSAQQKQQMDAVWAETRQKIEQAGERRHQIDKQRDAEIQALLSDQQRAEFEKIMTVYRAARRR